MAGAVFVLGWAVFLAAWAVNERARGEELDERGVEVPAEVVRVSVDDGGDRRRARSWFASLTGAMTPP